MYALLFALLAALLLLANRLRSTSEQMRLIRALERSDDEGLTECVVDPERSKLLEDFGETKGDTFQFDRNISAVGYDGACGRTFYDLDCLSSRA
jgi:hypothetical protein